MPSSLQGCFYHAEILPGRIVFFLSRLLTSGGTIHYELEGQFPGSNLVSPTVLRRAGRDAPLAVAKPKSLVVLPQGAKSSDPYRLSPDELLWLGAHAKGKGDIDAATRYYTELLDSWHAQPGFGLAEAAYKQTIFALMELGMGRAAPARLVQYCEVIKEKWPSEPVTLDQLLTAAGAYREIGEIERSYMACRATVEGSFTGESGVAGFLDTQGEFLRSVGLMNRLLRDYPPEPYLAEAEMGLAQRVYAKAAEAGGSLPSPSGRGAGGEGGSLPSPSGRAAAGEGGSLPSPSGRGAAVEGGSLPSPSGRGAGGEGLTREALIGRAWQKLEAFLTGYPADPAADQAAFAAANAQLDLKRFDEAGKAAAAYARRYPKSDLLDSYWYISAYCDFAAGNSAAAIEMCRKVAEAQHLDKQSGSMVDSTNKYRAIYILGQIHESLGQRADAIREYRRVEGRIADAKSSVGYFTRKQIALPDCTTLKPGAVSKSGTAEVELSYHNIAACDVKVYRVDLMKFCEAAQALGDLSQVNLAGIRPLYEASVALGDGADYRDHVRKLGLPLNKEGAYLVVCRGEDLYASGLLLISPVEIESRFDPATGQVRVFVKDAESGKYVSDAQVKVMPRAAPAQGNATGTTDLRGVFVGRCPASATTIVVQAGSGRYAYFATAPAAGESREAVAAAGRGEDDPTAPFVVQSRSADYAPLVDLIEKTVTAKPWAAPFPTNLSLRASQAQQVRGEMARRELRARLPRRNALCRRPVRTAPTLLSGKESPAERKIREALDQPTQMEFVDTPLKDVVDYLRDLHHIEIQLDGPALKEAGVEDSTPITKNLKGISLRSALKLLLEELQLKFVIHNEVLLITSPTKAESDEYMTTKVYPVADLLVPDRDGFVETQALLDTVTNSVATKTWADNGGTGTTSVMIVGNRPVLVVSQPEEVHEQIEEMLEMLRKAGGLKAGRQESQTPFVMGAVPAVMSSSTPSGDAPMRIRTPPRMGGGMGGMGGGMGGMGGGMGGMGGGMGGGTGAFGGAAHGMGGNPAGSNGVDDDSDLLGGLKGSNAANQGQNVLRLKQRQDAGQNNGMNNNGMGGGMF